MVTKMVFESEESTPEMFFDKPLNGCNHCVNCCNPVPVHMPVSLGHMDRFIHHALPNKDAATVSALSTKIYGPYRESSLADVKSSELRGRRGLHPLEPLKLPHRFTNVTDHENVPILVVEERQKTGGLAPVVSTLKHRRQFICTVHEDEFAFPEVASERACEEERMHVAEEIVIPYNPLGMSAGKVGTRAHASTPEQEASDASLLAVKSQRKSPACVLDVAPALSPKREVTVQFKKKKKTFYRAFIESALH